MKISKILPRIRERVEEYVYEEIIEGLLRDRTKLPSHKPF
jgi:hypothetical protein